MIFKWILGSKKLKHVADVFTPHCVKYVILPNFMVWKFCGKAQFLQFWANFGHYKSSEWVDDDNDQKFITFDFLQILGATDSNEREWFLFFNKKWALNLGWICFSFSPEIFLKARKIYIILISFGGLAAQPAHPKTPKLQNFQHHYASLLELKKWRNNLSLARREQLKVLELCLLTYCIVWNTHAEVWFQ